MSKKSIISKISVAVTTTATAVRLYTEYKGKWDNRRQFSLSLDEGDFLYIPLLKWISENIDGARHFQLYSNTNKITTGQNARKNVSFKIDGHTIKLETPDEKPRVEANQWGELDVKRQSITFVAQSKAGLNAFLGLCERLREKESSVKRIVTGYNCSSYGWNSRPLPHRYIDKVFLPRGEKETLMSDIEKFLGAEDDYANLGTPWHRGYLLYGPPGNGKTSLVQALAHYYEKDIYNLPLSAINSDAQLTERLQSVERNSFLLVEDIDIFKESVKREVQTKPGPTLAGLLNAFDGVNTPHGLITFFTTNIKDNLDPALIRAGRMDMHIEVKSPVPEQICDMFEGIYGETLGTKPPQYNSMADFVNVLKKHIGDPEGARLEIKSGRA